MPIHKKLVGLMLCSLIAGAVGGAAMVWLLNGATALAAPEKGDVLSCRVLEIKDANGKVRAWFGMEEGDPMILLMGPDGQPSAILAADAEGAALHLLGAGNIAKDPLQSKPGLRLFDTRSKKLLWEAPITTPNPPEPTQ